MIMAIKNGISFTSDLTKKLDFMMKGGSSYNEAKQKTPEWISRRAGVPCGAVTETAGVVV